MQSPNYFSGIVKILENPKETTVNSKIINLEFRALIPQIRKGKSPKIISVIFWGALATDTKNYYQINDYILIEGYVSIKTNKSMDSGFFTSKKIVITVLKVYPFLLKKKENTNKFKNSF